MGDMYDIYLIPLKDYNKLEQEQASLGEDEVLLYHTGDTYGKSKIQLGGQKFHIVKELDDMSIESKNKSRHIPAIYLGSLFRMATVLIIYYKQISEGYDDRECYHIMQKVGMSKKEVKHSIRNQILTVFFLPLIVAVIHIAVAFKVMTRLLIVLNFANEPLFFTCMVITVIVFAIFYAIVYAVTAKEYYRIVNEGQGMLE